MPRPLAMLYLVASMSMTGANVPLAKVLAAEIPVETLLLLRFALASALLAIVVRWERGPRLVALGWQDWGNIAILGLVGSVLFTWTLIEGVTRTTATSAGIITAALPAVVALIGVMVGERPRRNEVVMIGMAIAGILLVQVREFDGASIAPAPLLGNLLIGLAVLCEAVFVIAARGISSRVGPFRLSLGVALVSLFLCLPTGLAGAARLDVAALDARTWGLLAWYALTASVLCTVLWYRGVAQVEPWAAGLATAAVPVAALTVSALMLGEEISPTQFGGAALVIAAIVVGTSVRRGAP